jgi:hypothetical protein
MCNVGALGGQDEFGVGGDLDVGRAASGIGYGDKSYFRVVLC